MSRVLISADMEGASGVTSAQEVDVGSRAWSEMRSLLTSDVNAAAAGFFDGGAHEVLVAEAHADARNLDLDSVDRRISLIRGRPRRLGMMEGLDASVDVVGFVGYHAAAGGPGVLSHTFLPSGVISVKLDGAHASEGRLNAALAAERGVPVVLVTGDDQACADAEAWAPAAERVIVKRAIGRFAAICLAPAQAAERIRAAAREALTKTVPPASALSTPTTIDVEFAVTGIADVVSAIPTVEVIGPRSVRFSGDSVEAAYRCLWAVLSIARQAMDATYG